jgi:hypothetical protein
LIIPSTVIAGLAVSGAHFLPVPNRYLIEANAGLALVLGWCASTLGRRSALFGGVLLLVGCFGGLSFYERAWSLQFPSINPAALTGFRIADWIRDHVQGSRVVTAGEIEGYLNARTDTPQIGGSRNGILMF